MKYKELEDLDYNRWMVQEWRERRYRRQRVIRIVSVAVLCLAVILALAFTSYSDHAALIAGTIH